MVYFPLFAIFGLIALALAAPAPESRDSPVGAVYSAIFEKGVRGTVVFWSLGGYVSVGVALTNLPRQGGPFMYHIHERRVPADGSCAATLGHFNPYNGVLHAHTPAEAEVGDLSGKHGMIYGRNTAQVYTDKYLSLNARNKAFFGSLSVVIHLANGERIACANINRVLGPLTGAQKEAASVASELNLPEEVANFVT